MHGLKSCAVPRSGNRHLAIGALSDSTLGRNVPPGQFLLTLPNGRQGAAGPRAVAGPVRDLSARSKATLATTVVGVERKIIDAGRVSCSGMAEGALLDEQTIVRTGVKIHAPVAFGVRISTS